MASNTSVTAQQFSTMTSNMSVTAQQFSTMTSNMSVTAQQFSTMTSNISVTDQLFTMAINMSATDAPDTTDSLNFPLYAQILMGISLTLVSLVNVIGNVSTIAACILDNTIRKNVGNLYILNLAVTDLIVGIVSMPFYIVYTIMNYHWPFGYTLCKLYTMIDYLACSESACTITLISWDRYLLVSEGAGYFKSQTKKKVLIKIAVSWVIAWLMYGPAILFFNYWRGYSDLAPWDCYAEFSSDFLFTLVTSTVEFSLPLILIVTLNLLLYWDIRKRSRNLPGAAGGGNSQTTQQHKDLKKDRKAARALILLVITFVICWAPYSMTAIKAASGVIVNEHLFSFLTWLLWFNSTCNPFLYAYTNKRFRAFYQRTIFFCFKSNSVRPTSATGIVTTATGPTE
jgi:hypothetical protein